jgi:hypothetical protein
MMGGSRSASEVTMGQGATRLVTYAQVSTAERTSRPQPRALRNYAELAPSLAPAMAAADAED